MKAHWISSGTSDDGFEWQEDRIMAPSGIGMRARLVIDRPNFKEIWWLEAAVEAARSVAMVKLGPGSATGFLVAPNVFMTNHHVFENAQDAHDAKLRFNFRLLINEELAPRDEFVCDPDAMFKTNEDLDYTIVQVKPKGGKEAGDLWSFLNLRHGRAPRINRRANIIQHPQGRFQEIVFRDNQIKVVKEKFIQYLTDTQEGSSGSPVFDDFFRVVALHSQSVPDPDDRSKFRNQGFRIDAILEDAGDLIP